MELKPLERLKALKELRGALAQSNDAKTPIARLQAIKAVRAARERLGIGLAAKPAAPQSQLQALEKIANGGFDHQGLHEVMRLIQSVVGSLGGGQKMDAAHKDMAQKAIDHWVELEAA